MKTGFSFQEYVDAINKSTLLVHALNQFVNEKGKPHSITVDPNPEADTNVYLTGRSLVVIENQLSNPTRLARVLAHEIYGHDLTREIMIKINDPDNPSYKGKSPDQINALVQNGCYVSEYIGYIAEYRVGQQIGFDANGYLGIQRNIENAIRRIESVSPGLSQSQVDLAAAKFLADGFSGNDVSHIQQCRDWADGVLKRTNVKPSAQMVFRLDVDGNSGMTLISENFTAETAGFSFFSVGTDVNADGKIGRNLYSLNGVLQNVSNFDQLMALDYAFQAQRNLISQPLFNEFTKSTSNYLLGSSSLFGNPIAANPYGFEYPIGAFYDSKAPAADSAGSIAACTPVILDAAKKAMTVDSLAALDANNDGLLGAAELTGLNAWSDLNEDGVIDVGELQTLAQKGFTQINATAYGFYTAGNALTAGALLTAPAKRLDTTGMPMMVVKQVAQPVAPAMPAFVPTMLYRIARDLDNRYTVNANEWIDWKPTQIKISNDKKSLIGTDGDDRFDVNYWATYTRYFNVGLIENFVAGNGNDLMGGSSRGDKLWGGTGDDTVMGYEGDDSIYGEEGRDKLEGGAGNDLLDGGVDNDVLFGGVGNDTMNGGDGDDTLVGADSSGESRQTLAPGQTDNDLMYGGSGNDIVYAGAGNDIVDGGTGNDQLLGQGGNDTLFGGDGSDELQGGEGSDSLLGGAGDDKLFGQVGDDVLWGGNGDDVLFGFTANNEVKQTLAAGETDNDVIFGEAGDDTLSGGFGDDYLDGGVGNDYLIGGAGNDTLLGGTGADEFEGGDGNDYLDGGTGEDLILGQAGDDTLKGGEGNDDLQGGAGDDRLFGEVGNDKLFGQVGNDTLWGGDGNDVLVGFTPSNDTKQTLAAGETDDDTLFGGKGFDNLYGGFGNDYLDGGDDADLVIGNEGADNLFGGAGNDELQGGDGNDSLLGEAGDDRMFGQTGNDQMWGGDGNDIMMGFTASNEAKQALLAGETDNDTMYGGSGNDLMMGGLGDDQLHGEAGADELQGGAGNDMLYGGTGNDRLFGQGGNDTIYGGEGDDLILGSTAANEEAPTAEQPDNNWLYGGAGNDVLLGGAGRDYLDGGQGADFMEGGKGDDTYIVNSVNDTILEKTNEGYDVVISSANYLLNTGIEELHLLEGFDIHGTGNALDNKIVGNSRNNILDGVEGKDVMLGGAGNDTYYVDNLGDRVVEYSGEGIDTVQSSVGYTLGASVENLSLLDFSKPEKGLVDGTATLVYGYPKRNELDYMQGDAVRGYEGTCALTSIANLLTQAQRPTTEAQVVQIAINNSWAVTDQAKPAYQRGGSSYTDQQKILDNYGIRNDLLNGYNEHGIANLVRSGRGVILALNAGKLWSDADYTGNGAVNHAVTVTGAVYGETDGKLMGFYIADSGRQKVSDMTRYVNIEQFRTAANVPSAYAIYTLEPLKLWSEDIDGTGNELDNTITGNRGNNVLSGGAGNDVLDAGSGQDWLDGGSGDDVLKGQAGNDTYVAYRGMGQDTIADADTTAGNTDVLSFGAGISANQLWLRRAGNNLEISIIGSNDKATVQDWYLGSTNQIEQIKTSDGKFLLNSDVDKLVQAMAGFAPPAPGQMTLPVNYQSNLSTVLAANWH